MQRLASPMIGKRLIVACALLAAPFLAGCVDEPIHIAYRVADGESRTLMGDLLVEGSLLVEPNATLVLEGATLTVQQALLVQGRLVARDSAIRFAGPFERHEAQLDGEASFENTRVDGLNLVRVGAPATFRGGTIEARCLDTHADLESANVAWTFPSGSCDEWSSSWGSGPYGALVVQAGDAAFENGSLAFQQGNLAVRVDGGRLHLGNLTLDASHVGRSPLLSQRS